MGMDSSSLEMSGVSVIVEAAPDQHSLHAPLKTAELTWNTTPLSSRSHWQPTPPRLRMRWEKANARTGHGHVTSVTLLISRAANQQVLVLESTVWIAMVDPC